MPLMEERIDPSPETYDSVPFYNFTDRDFTIEDLAAWNGKPYEVMAGEIKWYPQFLANHLTKHLINREIMRVNPAQLNDQKIREGFKVKILITDEQAAEIKAGVKKELNIPTPKLKKLGKEEKIGENEAKTMPKIKGGENMIPSVEHTKEYAKAVDIKSLNEVKK